MGSISNNEAMADLPAWLFRQFGQCMLFAAFGACASACAATPVPNPPPERSSYWRERVSLFKTIRHRADVVMIGDSLTDGAEWGELFPEQNIANRGIESDTTDGLLARLGDIVEAKPKLAFVMIGINDFSDAHRSVAAVWANYQQIVSRLVSAGTQVIVLSTLPCNKTKAAWKSCAALNEKIRELNTQLSTLAGSGVTVIDMWPALVAKGNLKGEFTFDGIHLNGEGYRQWKNVIAPFMPMSPAPSR